MNEYASSPNNHVLCVWKEIQPVESLIGFHTVRTRGKKKMTSMGTVEHRSCIMNL